MNSRRVTLVVVVAISVAGPTAALADAGSPPPIDLTGTVWPIDTRGSVISLETTKHQGSATRVSISSDVLFGFDSAALSGSARSKITQIAARVAGHPKIKVDGYTDSVGSARYNQDLSQRRAQAVADVLRRVGQVRAAGHGSADPVAPNRVGGRDNPAGRAKNRRVTISY